MRICVTANRKMKACILVIPMKGQHEQYCNASALKKIGVPVLKRLSTKKHDKIADWINSEKRIEVSFPDETMIAIKAVLALANIKCPPYALHTTFKAQHQAATEIAGIA